MRKALTIFAVLFVSLAVGVFAGGTTESGGAAATSGAESQMKEAPMLAEMVAAGTLPPLEERLPEDVQVVKPVDQVGTYGGTLRTVDISGVDIAGLIKHGLFALAQDFETGEHEWYKGIAEGQIVPNIARGGEFSNDYKTFTLYLRSGLKWSDGEPCTADDYMFWWEDVVLNEEITADIPSVYKPGGEVMDVKKIDDYTIEFNFSVPYRFFKYYLIDTAVRHMPLRPKHYLQQFHIKYNKNANDLAKENGFDAWYEYFQNRGGGTGAGSEFYQNPDLPSLGPWVTVQYEPNLWVGERNPYYFKVDTDGKQLPYIDKIVCDISENTEVLAAKVVAGQVDYSAVALPFSDIPTLKDAESDGDFTTYLWDTPMGAMPSILINQTLDPAVDPFLRELFKDVRFRRALSVAINREEANQVAYFGVSYPTQAGALPGSRFTTPEYDMAWAQYDPDLANKLLDEIGLKWDGDHKWRLRPDNGEPVTIVIEDVDVGAIRGYSKIRPLLKEYWEAVGIQTVLKELEVSLWVERFFSNQVEVSMWGIDSIDDFNFQILGPWFIPGTAYGGSTWHAHAWHTWVNSGGEEGEEPPPKVKRMRELWLKMQQTTDEDEITRLGKEIFAIQADQLYVIGVVGSIKQPIAVKNNIGNFVNDGVWANNSSLIEYAWPFQWYFK